MKSGWIVWLTVASAFAITQARAAEPEKQIKCEVRALRVTDECFERMCRQSTPKCCATACEKSACCEKPASCPKSCCEPKPKTSQSLPTVMPTCKAKCVMDKILGDPRCEMMCCPRVMTLDGQSASICINSCRFFVTSVEQLSQRNQKTVAPNNEQFTPGFRMQLRPTIVPDGGSVILNVNCQSTELDCHPVPMFPVTTMITPVYEGGAQGKPIPFTQFIQQPSFTTRGAHRFAVCGEGQTMVLDCGRATRVRESENNVPFLCELPVVGDMFRSKSAEVVSDRLVVFVTPCVCTGEAGEECRQPPRVADDQPAFGIPVMCELPAETLPVAPRPMCVPSPVYPCPVACPATAPCVPAAAQGCWVGTPVTPPVRAVAAFSRAAPPQVRAAACPQAGCNAADTQLVHLMIEYHEACAAGDRAKARNLAAKCIALDPMCFSK